MCVYSQVSYSETSNDFCTMYQAAFSNSYSDCSPSDVWADELLSSFTSVCSNILDYIVPLKTRCFKSKSEPWLNNSTRVDVLSTTGCLYVWGMMFLYKHVLTFVHIFRIRFLI